jgi:DNA gyrase/topoisomerase IV subunit A
MAPGAQPEKGLAELFAHTSLETKIKVDMRALDAGVVRRTTLPVMLRTYVHGLANKLTTPQRIHAQPACLLAELETLRVQHDDTRRTKLHDAAALP